MGRTRKAKKEKEQKKKAVLVNIIDRQHGGQIVSWYRIVDELIEKHHQHLGEAKIAIGWRMGWKADVDGRLKLGSVKKGGDLDRELHGFDFVLLLNHERLNGSGFSEGQIYALLDHLLCRCQVSRDANGELRVDEKRRTVFRLRKPDIEEFGEVVHRHGLWTRDLEDFAEAVADAKGRPLLPFDPPAGTVAVKQPAAARRKAK